MRKICPVCGNIYTGRSDKRFCSLTCKNLHNNTSRREQITGAIDRALHHNRTILQRLLPDDSEHEIIPRQLLKTLGFNFNHTTGIEVSPEGQVFRLVYEFSWTEEEENIHIRRVVTATEKTT
jgi:hypothetical protein